MPILKYENLTHEELSGLQRDKTVVFICAGPLEQHGTHLPLGTDAMSAAYFSERIAERLSLSRPDWNFLLFPTLFAGSDTLTYTGSVEIKPYVLRALVYQSCKQLAKDGFRTIIAFGAHGGPRHMVVLEEVAARIRWRYRGARMISASAGLLNDLLHGRYSEKIAARMEKLGQPLSDDEKRGLHNDFHGGLIETSVMMVARPELVKPSHKTLEPAIVDGYWRIRRNSGKKVGRGLGHLGSPALARPEIGKAVVELFLDESAPLLERFLDGENVYKKFRSKFYYIPFFRTDFNVLVAFMVAAAAFSYMITSVTKVFTENYK